MKILLIGCFDLHMHPYYKKYFDILSETDCDYTMIYWNRSGKIDNNNLDKHLLPFNEKINTYASRKSKIMSYIKYRKFVKGVINSKTYDKTIFLTTQTMVYFFDYAIFKYKNRYIFDYRDETYEKNALYKYLVNLCLKKSYLNVFSSPGFLTQFPKIPDNKNIICHNNKKYFSGVNLHKIDCDKIRLTFWGQVRLPDYFLKLIKVFENDERFIVNFHGEGENDKLIKYVSNNCIKNVFFTGSYQQNDILKFAENTDFVINCYSNNSYQKLALTVKMYEAIDFKLPMIIQKRSYMENFLIANNYPFFSIDLDDVNNYDKIKTSLLEYKVNFTDDVKKRIEKDESLFKQRILNFLED